MKIGIYARVSTDDKGQDVGIQIDRCKQYCQAQGWDFEIFQDHESGYLKPSEERPGFSSVMNKIKTRELDGIIVYAMDRFSREDPFKVYKSIETIHKVHKALFISITDGVDSRTDVFPIVLSVMSSGEIFVSSSSSLKTIFILPFAPAFFGLDLSFCSILA